MFLSSEPFPFKQKHIDEYDSQNIKIIFAHVSQKHMNEFKDGQ